MYPAIDLRIHHHRQQQLLDEAEKARLARTIEESANQGEDHSSLAERRLPRLWVRMRRVAFGY